MYKRVPKVWGGIDNRCARFIILTFSFIVDIQLSSLMTTWSILVRVYFYVLGFSKLEAL